MLYQMLRLMRPKQWTKNGFVLAPMLFSFRLHDAQAWPLVLLAMAAFIGLSSCTYIVNDILDREEDRAHPVKSKRPIASGALSVAQALVGLGVIFALTLLALAALPSECAAAAAAYLLLQVLYNWRLKHVALLDVLAIASGFVLRVLMGGFAIDVPMSAWILLSTMLLACFLGFGKRQHEFSIDGYAAKRKSLQQYNAPLLDRLISVSCAAVLMSYALYAVEMSRADASEYFIFTVLLVMVGLFRYLQVVYLDKKGGDPEQILLKDGFFIANGLAWLVSCMLLLGRV